VIADIAQNVRQQSLLTWYAAVRRDLPWRAPPGQLANPYHVLVSELMLQQTRVQTVIDYFERWTLRWPTLADLAAASSQDVLAMWTGLGYYNRARNLHKAAQLVVAGGAGLPQNANDLQVLPGLGPYTVGAVLSIGYGQPAALVDGNVARVLARWLALQQDPMVGRGKATVWGEAERLLQAGTPAHADPASWNQALMELGATVCTPKSPACSDCPVANGCLAAAQRLQNSIPPPRQKAASQVVRAAYGVVLQVASGVGEPGAMPVLAADDCWVLLARQPAGGRWAGLWQPPGVEAAQAAQAVRQLLAPRLQVDRQLASGQLPVVVHLLTHRRYEAEPLWWLQQTASVTLDDPDLRWMTVKEALGKTSGLSRLGQRLIAVVWEELTSAAPRLL
jgi:A/G-specific adenine glycosylase